MDRLKNIFSKNVQAPVPLQTLAQSVYKKYREVSNDKTVDLAKVKKAHYLFGQLIKYTGSLVDEYEFRRRLISSSADLNKQDTIIEKVEATSNWLEKQTSITAGQAEDILHNLYFGLHLHSFSPDVKQVFEQITEYCIQVEQNGIFSST
ncbi:hypothetical protein ISG33_12985 [Glaciecola sp. MH2013]|uniref:hypothetical protein n=1 Tax=Glaciecola sp. MH2013 TaxID=2785524 RepID=UPI0018A0C04E|nr:hypothetical protein [Glaciecola sp. MH2013]MBF7074315.1 hypothetical protein [Glaciecola sp. MH2013]